MCHYDERRYDERRYDERCYDERRYAECRYAECRYAERHYAECRGAFFSAKKKFYSIADRSWMDEARMVSLFRFAT